MDVIWVAVLVAVIWGTLDVIYRWVLPIVSRQFVMMVSAIVYGISVFVYVFFFGKEMVIRDIVHNYKYIPMLVVTTFIGIFLTQLLYLYAIKHTDNINVVAVIISLYPVVTLLLAGVLLKEYLDFRGLIGFGLIVIGMIVMLTTPRSNQIEETFINKGKM